MRDRTMQMKRNILAGLGWVAAVLLACPLPSPTQESVGFNFPDDVLTQFSTAAFAQDYSISRRINPFYLRGDFDGDGRPDYAILVTAKKDQSRGIAIWLSSKNKIYVIGAGHPFKFSGEESSDFDFIDDWQVYEKKPVETGVEAGPPPRLIGEAILAGKSEDGSGLIYWNGTKFLWYQQGD